MIFTYTWRWIFDRSPHTGVAKTQTLRRAWRVEHEGESLADTLVHDGRGRLVTVLRGWCGPVTVTHFGGIETTRPGRQHVLYGVGRVRAVQVERCHRAVGHITIASLAVIENPMDLTGEQVTAEGFASLEDFRAAWRKIHGKHCERPAYAIGLGGAKLTRSGESIIQRVGVPA